MRNEALAARNSLSLGQARAAADGAVERTVYELSRPRAKDAWSSDGRPHRWQDGEIRLTPGARDILIEAGIKIVYDGATPSTGVQMVGMRSRSIPRLDPVKNMATSL